MQKAKLNILMLLPMLLSILPGCIPTHTDSEQLQWGQLPALPDSIGFAGSFAGVSNGALVAAGGANFGRGGTPWNGASKTWYDQTYVLEEPKGEWKKAGKLPRPLGYGVSVSWKDGLICIGGSNAAGHYADVFILHYKNGEISSEALPPLPKTNANACGAVIGNIVYLAGGMESPDSKTSEKIFWSLDLSQKEKKWQELPAWPGPSRMMAVAGVQNGMFYLFGGGELFADEQGRQQRRFLNDAYQYNPEKGWTKLADLPMPAVAAPSPAFDAGDAGLLVLGGDNGKYFDQNDNLRENHPGFSDKIWAYHPESNSWSDFGTIPVDKKPDAAANPNNSTWAPVTTPLVVWNGDLILPGGEARPGTRTPRILKASLIKNELKQKPNK